jgi:hypothetical protein
MKSYGVRPYPMVYQAFDAEAKPANSLDYRELRRFQRWCIRKYYTFIPWDEYDPNKKGRGTA